MSATAGHGYGGASRRRLRRRADLLRWHTYRDAHGEAVARSDRLRLVRHAVRERDLVDRGLPVRRAEAALARLHVDVREVGRAAGRDGDAERAVVPCGDRALAGVGVALVVV